MDDGKWYFTSAGVTPNATGTTVSKMGLGMYEMKSPTEIDKSSVMDTGLIMDNTWTEGPMLIKYGHRYFMTYCGNHYLSPGYRINYAYGDSPISLTEATNSPILINTNPSVDVAIGHNSLVVGPNLDSMYIVYHSMVNPSLGRNDDIDPIYINGKHMQALGPTTTVQQAPEMPDVYSHFDAEDSLAGWKAENASIVDGKLTVSEGGRVLSEKTFDGNYTAEFNFLTINGKAGAIFEYTDENNFASAIVDTAAKELVITFKANGEDTVYNVPVKGSFDEDLNFGVLQCLTVKKSDSSYTFLLNNLTVHECENTLASGAVGVTSVSGDAKFGFVGAEGNVWMSSYKELAKPIEGEIQAITCIEENVTLADHNDINYLTVNGGEAYNYYVNVTDKANFDLGIHYTASVDTKFDLYFNGKLLTRGTLTASDNRDNTEIIRGLALPAGSGVFTIRVNEGKADIFSYEFTVHEDIAGVTLDISAPFYSEGEWEVDDGEFESFGDGKYLYGNENWGDYTYSITLEGAYSNHISNVLFRASEAALGGANDNIKEGKNFFIGYFVNIKTSGKNATLSLNKQIYAPTELYSVEAELTHDGGPCTVKITTKGSNIKVYLDDTLVIDYTDPKPIMNGAVGFQFTEKIAYAYASDIKISE